MAVKMHLGNKKSCKKVVMVSFLANLADLDKNQESFSALNLAMTLSTCSFCFRCSSKSFSIKLFTLSFSFFLREAFKSLFSSILAGAAWN